MDEGLWQAAFKLVALYGAPTAISLGLVWWLATKIERDLQLRAQEHQQILGSVLEDRAIFLREIDRARGMLYRICVNGATSTHELAVCNYQEEPNQFQKAK
jgi:hypothetical protein